MTLVTRGAIHRNSYRDSVELMGIAAQLEAMDGIQRAGLVMATPANLGVLTEAGLAGAVPNGANPNDLIVAVAADGSLSGRLSDAAGLFPGGFEQDPVELGGADHDLRVGHACRQRIGQFEEALRLLRGAPLGGASP